MLLEHTDCKDIHSFIHSFMMRVGVAPRWDKIPIRGLWKCVLTSLPWLVPLSIGLLSNGHVLLEWCTTQALALNKPSTSHNASPRAIVSLASCLPQGEF